MKLNRVVWLILGVLLLAQMPVGVGAVDAGDFNTGRMMDDSVFVDTETMSADDVQAFLERMVPDCDTNGEKLSELGGPDINNDGKVQRWEWGSVRGETSFICLRNYQENGVLASQIISSISQQYDINPQVLLALIQKESELVLDEWPVTWQYERATGFGCPSAAPCDPGYIGFTNQVTKSARMLHAILTDDPNWYAPYDLGENYIQYSPRPECGGSVVHIENRATVALYSYTPYQPNRAALNAGFGVGDACSSYGNRNFWLYFTNWFGSTLDNETPVATLTVNGKEGDTVTYGSDITLRWSSDNADSCSIFSFGEYGLSGEVVVAKITQSVSYTIECTGDGEIATDTANVIVLPPTFAYLQDLLRTAELTPAKAAVLQGQSQQVELAERAYTAGDTAKATKLLQDVSSVIDKLANAGKVSGVDGIYIKSTIADLIKSWEI